VTRAFFGLSALFFLGGLPGCNGSVSGDFDGLGWSPTFTSFAVADRHELLELGGTLQATQRPDSQKRLTLLFSGALANPNEDWRWYRSQSLLSLRKDLATLDGLLLYDLPLAEVEPGAEFELALNTGTPGEPRDFKAAVLSNTNQAIATTDQSFGTALEMKLEIADADPRAHGYVAGTFELTRSRGEEQEGEVATGEVILTFQVPVVAERRGKANLAIARPIMVCAGEVGPTRASSCADEPPEHVPENVDAISGL